MSKVMDQLEQELNVVLAAMAAVDEKQSEVYDELVKHAKVLGDILNKNAEIKQKEAEEASRKEVELEKISLEREKIALEREKIESEEKKNQDKVQAELVKSRNEKIIKIAGICAGVAVVILALLFGVQVLAIEKEGVVTCRNAFTLAMRFLTAKPMFV